MSNIIAVYGASGHGKVVADIAKANGYKDIIFIDDGLNNYISFEEFLNKFGNLIPVALGIGENRIRGIIYNKLKANDIKIQTLIHPSSIISKSVTIGEGSVVMPLVVVNADAKIGKGVILNSSCVIEHDNIIGDFAHISPNASLAGNVKIGNFSHIGIGSNIIQGKSIGEHTIIGAGSVVIDDIPSFCVGVGVPVKVIRKNKPPFPNG